MVQKIGFLLLLCCIVLACETKDLSQLPEVAFFDLKAYFKTEQSELDKIKKVRKTVNVDGVLESKTVEINGVDFEEELALFVDSDINKVSWLDQYETESLMENGKIKQLRYIAKKEQLKTQKLTVHFEGSVVDSIHILRKTSSIAAQLEQELTYLPNQGYRITSRQQTTMSDENEIALDVVFLD